MMKDEIRKKIDKECITFMEAQKNIKKNEKSEHKYRFQNFLNSCPIKWLDEKELNSIWPKKGYKIEIFDFSNLEGYIFND